jgi:hypothetical protein
MFERVSEVAHTTEKTEEQMFLEQKSPNAHFRQDLRGTSITR